MNNTELQLVSYEQAVRLKELGFDYKCIEICFTTPTVALALKWMRDVKGIRMGIKTFESWYSGEYLDYFREYTERTDSYELAESALLDKLLTVLEKEKEGKG